jgi:hypothetical protein
MNHSANIMFPVARPTSKINSRAGSMGIRKCKCLLVALKKLAMFDVISSLTMSTMSILSMNSELNAHHCKQSGCCWTTSGKRIMST